MIGIVRGLITLALLVLFIALVAWAWSDRRKKTFDSMARMALEDEDPAPSNTGAPKKIEGKRP